MNNDEIVEALASRDWPNHILRPAIVGVVREMRRIHPDPESYSYWTNSLVKRLVGQVSARVRELQDGEGSTDHEAAASEGDQSAGLAKAGTQADEPDDTLTAEACGQGQQDERPVTRGEVMDANQSDG